MRIPHPGRAVDVVVVVPARNESARIGRCLRSVRISLEHAVAAGAVHEMAIAVVGHRCVDDTLGTAGHVLAGLRFVLVPDEESTTVGAVRSLGVLAALDLLPRRPGRGTGPGRSPASARHAWVLNTDADSVVPASWVVDVLRRAGDRHQAVIGMTTLSPMARSEPQPAALHHRPDHRLDHHSAALTAYRNIIRAGIRGQSHDHVYGANLAVRADAYAAVGGFPAVRLGEDRGLLDALLVYGRPVVRPRDVVVGTSARRDGRAAGGLASLLSRLDRTYLGQSPTAPSQQ